MPSNGVVDHLWELSEQLAWLDFELTGLCERVGDLVTENGSPVPTPQLVRSSVEGTS